MPFRFLISALTILTLCLSSGGKAQTKKSRLQQKTAAEVAWPAFFKSFRDAVARKDRVAMKRMMVADFFFSGGSDDNEDGDFRDEAFKFLDAPDMHGWQAFSEVLAKGAVPSPSNPNAGGKKNPTRVAPPSARTVRSLTNAPPWIAAFEYRDGHWYCTSFSECCD